MKTKTLILILFVIILAASVVLPKFRKSQLPITMGGTALFDGGTRIYLHTTEKLVNMPVAFVRTPPPNADQTQLFDISIYRNERDAPKDGEILLCEEGDCLMESDVRKEGANFYFFIDHSTVEGDKYEFFVNGKNFGSTKIGPRVVGDKQEDDADTSEDEQYSIHQSVIVQEQQPE